MAINDNAIGGIHSSPETEGDLTCDKVPFYRSRDNHTGVYAFLITLVRLL